MATASTPATRIDSPAGRWIVAATVLGSGAVFLEGSVVTVALPAMARGLGLGIAGLQWVMNGYLLTLSALMLLGGALGDRYDRARVFTVGLVAFAITSVGCALAPTAVLLVGCRVLQGAAGALVVPNSLALLETRFDGEARGVAIGRWAAWSAISTAIGPLLGGWLVDALSWRWVFAVVVAVSLAAAGITAAHFPPDPQRPTTPDKVPPLDVGGAALVTLGLAGVVGALIAAPDAGYASGLVLGAGIGGVLCLAAFLVVEHRAARPLLPLDVFRSRQFSGANLVTLFVYAALSGLFFLLMLELQNVLGYRALAAGAMLLPVNVLMLLLSPRAGRWAQRIGPRLPMALGGAIAGVGMLLFARVGAGASFLWTLLPAILVFGVGLSILVAPLTAAVLGAVEDRLAGVASAVNNAVARLAGLLATAAIPLAVGLGKAGALQDGILTAGFQRAMWLCAGLCFAGALLAWGTIRAASTVTPSAHPSPHHGCTRTMRS